jgi:hypothetical protein
MIQLDLFADFAAPAPATAPQTPPAAPAYEIIDENPRAIYGSAQRRLPDGTYWHCLFVPAAALVRHPRAINLWTRTRRQTPNYFAFKATFNSPAAAAAWIDAPGRKARLARKFGAKSFFIFARTY